MSNPRTILITLGVLLLLVGGWWNWRASQPVLNDEQQVAAVLEDVRAAVESRNAGRVAGYLAEDFSWNGQNKRELNSMMQGAFFQWRDTKPNITGLKISVNGTSATADGKFSLAYRPNQRGRAETVLGTFKATLEKRDGQWLITSAEGSETAGN